MTLWLLKAAFGVDIYERSVVLLSNMEQIRRPSVKPYYCSQGSMFYMLVELWGIAYHWPYTFIASLWSWSHVCHLFLSGLWILAYSHHPEQKKWNDIMFCLSSNCTQCDCYAVN